MNDAPLKLVVSTRNVKKLEELEALLRDIRGPEGQPFLLLSAAECGVGEVEETGSTFLDNAVLKAAAAFEKTGGICLADDSGLVVDALDGAPGVYSARFSGEGATDATNNTLLLEKLKEVPEASRQAAFVCHLALIIPKSSLSQQALEHCMPHADLPKDAALIAFEGRVEGRIISTPRGQSGFGYDPLFLHVPSALTFAELDAATKNRISHRGRALAKLSHTLRKIWSRG
jgi:XTP/dITP diphosphohydrolase